MTQGEDDAKFSVLLRLDTFGEEPQLVLLADFPTRAQAEYFMEPMREHWRTSVYIEEN